MKPGISSTSIGLECAKFIALVFCALLGMATSVRAQANLEIGTGSESAKFTNSLGMMFRQLPDSPVMMSVWETRVSDWDAYLQWQKEKVSWNHRPAFSQTAEHPIVNIALGDATMFCEWLTKVEHAAGLLGTTQQYRLPTGDEWNSAVGFTKKEVGRSSSKSSHRFPWGDNWPPMRQSGNYNFKHMQAGRDDGFPFTAPVGQFMPVRGGFFDLGGNVWEWTRDATNQPAENATLRGGSWMYWRQDCLESGYEYSTSSSTRSPTIGFRCVLEDTKATAEHRRRVEHEEAQMRLGLTERSEVTEDEVARIKAQMQERKEKKKEVDPAERAKLLEKPTVNQNEIEEFRKALNGSQDVGTNPGGQKPPIPNAVEPGK